MHSPLDTAILAHEHPAIGDYAKRAELPLDFQRRRVSVLAAGTAGLEVITKGAPEGLLPLCFHIERAGAVMAFTPERRREAAATFAHLSNNGFHLLSIAHKPVPAGQTDLTLADEQDLVFSGIAAFLDPPDRSARETVAHLRERGVAIKILTGDGELVTRAICQQVGLAPGRVVLGHQLDAMSDDALGAVVEQTDVFARVSPAQKTRIIHALKRKGHVVGYLGNGINDAPSLHAADVGISVSNGVGVSVAVGVSVGVAVAVAVMVAVGVGVSVAVAVSVAVFLLSARRRNVSWRARIGAAVIVAVLTAFTIVGQTGTAAMPVPATLAAQSLVFIAVVAGMGWWLDRRPTGAS